MRAAAGGRRRRAPRRTRLGARLAAFSAALTAAVVVAAFVALSVRIRATTHALVADQVGQGQRTLQALQRRADQQFVAAAALVAASPTVRSAVATARVEHDLADATAGGPDAEARRADLSRTVRRELERLAPNVGRDLIATTDEQGKVFAAYVVPEAAGAASGAAPAAGADLTGLAAVRHALDPALDGGGSDLYLSVLRVGDTYYHVSVAPIVLDGFTTGAVLLGERLDAAHLRALQQEFGGEILLVADGRTIGSTMRSVPTPLVAATSSGAADRPPRSVRAGDVEYVVASLSVGATQQGVPVQLALVHAVTPTLQRTTRSLLLQFVVCGLIAVGVAGVGAALLARSLLQPLEAFVRRLRASRAAGHGAAAGAEGAGRATSGAMPAREEDADPVAVEIRWLHVSFARLMASLGRKQAQLEQRGAELAYQAYHDPLTSLANRARFRAEVERALAREGQDRDAVGVLYLDLDHFKTVNDSLGHAVGDQLLIEVARRLLNATRGCDTVARLGGDEFAVLLDHVQSDADALVVVERIRRALRAPVALERAEVLVGASVGVARAARGDGADELLRNADVAMYRAKQQGRGRHELFAPAMHAAVVERLELEADLRRALADPDAELRLVYQPIVALEGERVVGVEALVRWDHPTRGLVSPGTFIPLAEATGLILPLGRWGLRTACRQAASWAGEDADGPYVSVNISGRQLENARLVDEVATALTEAGLAPGRLLLEITESVVMQRADAALQTLHALKALGVRVAIDDFGTGYSSLAYLQRFPVDVLKIDKAFIDGVAAGGSDAALARAIVGLAATLGLSCVAEGIEHVEQVAELRSAGCGYGQGYYFARPIAAHAVTALLTGQRGAFELPAPASRSGTRT